MKRLVLCLSVLLTACHSPQSRFRVGVSQCSDDAWRQKMNDEMRTEALLHDNLELEFLSAEGNSEKQVSDIRYFMEQGVDLLVVAPNEAIPVTPVVEEAYDRGIPVIIVDRKIMSDRYTAYIGADNYKIGKIIGEYVARQLDGRGDVLELTGLSGSTPAIDRHQGFANALKPYPGIRVLCSADAHWLREDAEKSADSLCRLYPEVDIVFAHNDQMALGAWQAAGRVLDGRAVDIVGIDGLPGAGNGIEMVRSGIFKASFIYPTGGDRIIATAAAILRGEPFDRETLLSTAIVDRTNAAVLDMQSSEIIAQQRKIARLKSLADSYLLRYSTQRAISWLSLFCLALIAAISVLLWRSLRIKNRLNRVLVSRNDEINRQKDRLEEQRDQLVALSNRLEEATQAKLIFFTNISHDLRTPLTLIVDPVELLLSRDDLADDQRFYLEIIRRNARILLRMTNQILDFRKYENGKLELHPVWFDLAACCRVWSRSFEMSAAGRSVEFCFESDPSADFRICADEEKLERVYYNLLSNAFKFTPRGGRIAVSLKSGVVNDSPSVDLCVTNSGSYISPSDCDRIFDRFYQTGYRRGGAGIGLALSKIFIEMHGGVIQVESNREQGTSFRVMIPVDKREVPPEVLPPVVAEMEDSFPEPVSEQRGDEEAESVPNESAVQILIVDDNADIRSYLRRILGNEYDVLEAVDGAEGLEKAVEFVPDLIVSDIMMPRIDGVEYCRRIKQSVETCHIPVVLLTACTLDEQRVEGLHSGADAYVTKPFSTAVLLATVQSLLRNRAKLRWYYEQEIPGKHMAFEDRTLELSPLDQTFIDRVHAFIERHLDDSEYGVDEIVREIGMSRAQFYRKIKALTDYSPNEYIRIIRLGRATELLAEGHLTIAEVSYRVGFSSPSYFTKCFKAQYGALPTEWMERYRKE
ncbi:MAG TPA: substrate-binding domain-containing protein [Candidatus Alistipes intestinipullorum]|nr:substrate-binding domain-containing protein [Candidatus Alistipes intestinipullorum]